MYNLDLTLVIYESSKGHFSQTDIYHTFLSDLSQQTDLNKFADKIVHIKDSGEGTVDEMVEKYEEYGFRCFVTEGKWKHFDTSHFLEYEKDIIRVSKLIKNSNYVWHVESDWVLRTYVDTLNINLFDAIKELKSDNSLYCIRLPHHKNDPDHVKSKPYSGQIINKINRSDFLSLNPHVCRSRDYYLIGRAMEINLSKLGNHIEHEMSYIARQLFETDKPLFGAFESNQIRARHIGVENWKEEYRKICAESS